MVTCVLRASLLPGQRQHAASRVGIEARACAADGAMNITRGYCLVEVLRTSGRAWLGRRPRLDAGLDQAALGHAPHHSGHALHGGRARQFAWRQKRSAACVCHLSSTGSELVSVHLFTNMW